MADLDTLFTRWLDGERLTEQELERLRLDSGYAAMMAEAETWRAHADDYRDEAVPAWPKESLFEVSSQPLAKTGWLQSGLIAASVLLGFMLYGQQEAGESEALKQQIARQSELLERQQEQIGLMQQMIRERTDDQQEQMLALAKEVIATGRLERKQDMASLVKYLDAQRAQDHALWRLQLNDLAEQVEEQGTSALAQNSEY